MDHHRRRFACDHPIPAPASAQRRLVAECGFTLVGIESSHPDTIPLNRWVAGEGEGEGEGENAPAEAANRIGGMLFWTWNTQEVRDLVTMLRTDNEKRREADRPPEEQVKWYGFDMQSTETAFERLIGLLERAESPLAAAEARRANAIVGESPRGRFGNMWEMKSHPTDDRFRLGENAPAHDEAMTTSGSATTIS